jgi:hypothetical protein
MNLPRSQYKSIGTWGFIGKVCSPVNNVACERELVVVMGWLVFITLCGPVCAYVFVFGAENLIKSCLWTGVSCCDGMACVDYPVWSCVCLCVCVWGRESDKKLLVDGS